MRPDWLSVKTSSCQIICQALYSQTSPLGSQHQIRFGQVTLKTFFRPDRKHRLDASGCPVGQMIKDGPSFSHSTRPSRRAPRLHADGRSSSIIILGMTFAERRTGRKPGSNATKQPPPAPAQSAVSAARRCPMPNPRTRPAATTERNAVQAPEPNLHTDCQNESSTSAKPVPAISVYAKWKRRCSGSLPPATTQQQSAVNRQSWQQAERLQAAGADGNRPGPCRRIRTIRRG